MSLEARWCFEDVRWGVTECQRRRCSETAVLLSDGVPLCLDCADDEIERLIAVELSPRMRELLPSIEGR